MLYDVENGSPSVRVATGLRSRWLLAVEGRLSTGHLPFVRSMRQRLPHSTPAQQPGTVRTGTAAPVGAPTAVDILASFPPVRGLVFGSTACGGSREVGILLAQAASSSAQRQWRSLGARSMLDARSFMISTLRSQVGFAAAVAHARLRLSRLELIGGSGRTAGRYASAARAFISPTAFEQARGGALGAGGGRVGFAGGGLF
jgi:hypothetical protein